MSRPILLDVYCCAGGAAMGYHRAGFDVIGVDIEPQPNYPFEFVQDDALRFLAALNALGSYAGVEFAAVHASPPCQGYLNLGGVNRAQGRDYEHPDLVAATRDALRRLGLPYIIENVENAPLINPVRLCGSSFGLPLRRHRMFESNVPLVAPPCNHKWQKVKRYWTGWRPNGETRKATVVQIYGNGGGREEWGPALGVDWMSPAEMCEAIPPAYTEFLGRQLARFVELANYDAEAA